jgi:hypothetical protein
MNDLSLVNGPFINDLFPFSLIRSVADIRCGIFTIREKWFEYHKHNPLLSQISIPANILQELVGSLLKDSPSALYTGRKINNCSDVLRLPEEEITHDLEQIRSVRALNLVCDQ